MTRKMDVLPRSCPQITGKPAVQTTYLLLSRVQGWEFPQGDTQIFVRGVTDPCDVIYLLRTLDAIGTLGWVTHFDAVSLILMVGES